MDGATELQYGTMVSPPPVTAILPGCSATDWWCVSLGAPRCPAAGSHIAGLLENLMGVSMQKARQDLLRTPVNLRARTCYDHLAGGNWRSIFMNLC